MACGPSWATKEKQGCRNWSCAHDSTRCPYVKLNRFPHQQSQRDQRIICWPGDGNSIGIAQLKGRPTIMSILTNVDPVICSTSYVMGSPLQSPAPPMMCPSYRMLRNYVSVLCEPSGVAVVNVTTKPRILHSDRFFSHVFPHGPSVLREKRSNLRLFWERVLTYPFKVSQSSPIVVNSPFSRVFDSEKMLHTVLTAIAMLIFQPFVHRSPPFSVRLFWDVYLVRLLHAYSERIISLSREHDPSGSLPVDPRESSAILHVIKSDMRVVKSCSYDFSPTAAMTLHRSGRCPSSESNSCSCRN